MQRHSAQHWFDPLPPELHPRFLDEQITGEAVAASPSPMQHWTIGAYVDEGTNEEINAYARAEVKRGAGALLYRLYHQPDGAGIHKLLRGIDPTGVELHCSLRYAGQDPAQLFRDLVRYLRSHKVALSRVQGSVDFDPFLDWSEPPFPPLVRLMKFVARWMPHFSVLQVNAGGFNHGVEAADYELALALAKGAEYLKCIKEQGYPMATAQNHLQFAVTMGDSYTGNVAKLRALRSLWRRVTAGFGLEAAKMKIAAHTDVSTLGYDVDKNEGRLFRQAHAAVQGGADLLFLTPLEQVDDAPTVRGRNYAIQTQHQLKDGCQAFIDAPTLGRLTETLVNDSWKRYHDLVEQGGFAMAIDL